MAVLRSSNPASSSSHHSICPIQRNSCVALVNPASRKPSSPRERSDLPEDLTDMEAARVLSSSRHYADLAASVQLCTEELVLHLVAKASAIAGTRNVCLAGGVALNSLANGRLIREGGYNLFVHPAAGDAGNAIGAAASYYHRAAKQPRMQGLASPYAPSVRRSTRRKSKPRLPRADSTRSGRIPAMKHSLTMSPAFSRMALLLAGYKARPSGGRGRSVPVASWLTPRTRP